MSRRFMLTRYAVAVVVATISVSGIPGHSREISESSLDSTASSTLQWPIRNAVESQPFAGTDGGQKGRFHTGSDIVPSPSVYLFNGNTADESNYSVEVFPAASGMVVMAQEMPAPGTPGFASWCKTEQPDPATASTWQWMSRPWVGLGRHPVASGSAVVHAVWASRLAERSGQAGRWKIDRLWRLDRENGSLGKRDQKAMEWNG